MFQTNTADLNYLFESAGQPILINDIKRQAIITNPSIGEYEERYIHTLETVYMGDIVALDNEKYLVISESVSKRNTKYKALMRHCNQNVLVAGEIEKIQIGVDPNTGRPIYEEVQGDPIPIPAIVDNKSFTVSGTQFQIPENQIVVIVQDNEINRNKFKVNDTFSFEGNYKVLHRDFTKKGLMILTCESVV